MISKDIHRSSEAVFGAHLKSDLVRSVKEGAFANLGGINSKLSFCGPKSSCSKNKREEGVGAATGHSLCDSMVTRDSSNRVHVAGWVPFLSRQ